MADLGYSVTKQTFVTSSGINLPYEIYEKGGQGENLRFRFDGPYSFLISRDKFILVELVNYVKTVDRILQELAAAQGMTVIVKLPKMYAAQDFSREGQYTIIPGFIQDDCYYVTSDRQLFNDLQDTL